MAWEAPIERSAMPPLGAALLAAAVLTSGFVAATTVWPVLTGAARPLFADRWLLVLLHALTGSVALIAGPLNLWIGETRQWWRWHRHVGCTYLGAGFTMAACSLWLSLLARGEPASLYVSTATLSLVWIGAGAMGWRAGANRRIAQHRDWMIRSYVLTWTFVFCRIAQRQNPFEALGPGATTAGVWLFWVGPLLLAEAALQWRRGGRGGKA